ncbi:hypothetical protein P9112_014042 [Eukaryota sp. TZLM1-RC]
MMRLLVLLCFFTVFTLGIPTPRKLPVLPFVNSRFDLNLKTPIYIPPFHIPLLIPPRFTILSRETLHGSEFSLKLGRASALYTAPLHTSELQLPQSIDYQYIQGALSTTIVPLICLLIGISFVLLTLMFISFRIITLNYCFCCFKLPADESVPKRSRMVVLLTMTIILTGTVLLSVGNMDHVVEQVETAHSKADMILANAFNTYEESITVGIAKIESLIGNVTDEETKSTLKQWKEHKRDLPNISVANRSALHSWSGFFVNVLQVSKVSIIGSAFTLIVMTFMLFFYIFLNSSARTVFKTAFGYFITKHLLTMSLLLVSFLGVTFTLTAVLLNDLSGMENNQEKFVSEFGIVATVYSFLLNGTEISSLVNHIVELFDIPQGQDELKSIIETFFTSITKGFDGFHEQVTVDFNEGLASTAMIYHVAAVLHLFTLFCLNRVHASRSNKRSPCNANLRPVRFGPQFVMRTHNGVDQVLLKELKNRNKRHEQREKIQNAKTEVQRHKTAQERYG